MKRLENKVSKNLPEWLDEQQQKDFISEKTQAIELYLKADTKERQQEATKQINKVDEKYNHEIPNGFYDRYSVEELKELLRLYEDEV